MTKNKYIYNYKDITMTAYASNIRWARFNVRQLYYYINSGMYMFGDRIKNDNTKVYYLDFKEFGYDIEMEIKATSFPKAMRKVVKLYNQIIDEDKEPDEIMGLEVIKYE